MRVRHVDADGAAGFCQAVAFKQRNAEALFEARHHQFRQWFAAADCRVGVLEIVRRRILQMQQGGIHAGNHECQ